MTRLRSWLVVAMVEWCALPELFVFVVLVCVVFCVPKSEILRSGGWRWRGGRGGKRLFASRA